MSCVLEPGILPALRPRRQASRIPVCLGAQQERQRGLVALEQRLTSPAMDVSYVHVDMDGLGMQMHLFIVNLDVAGVNGVIARFRRQ